jgi:MoaA/NifB/PqqE/SkfB family radical SAM enzyme
MRFNKKIDVYGHRSDLSFSCAKGRDYFRNEAKLGLVLKLPLFDVTLKIHLNKFNFLYLEDMINHYLKILDKNNHKKVMIKNRGLLRYIKENLVEDFKEYVSHLNLKLKPKKINIIFEDKELQELFMSIGQKIEKEFWKDFFNKLYTLKGKTINLNDELRVLGIILEKTFIGPIDIVLDLIHICNTNCIHCWIHSPVARKRSTPEFKNQIMDFENFKTIVDDANELGVTGITLLGDGEPLLHPHYLNMLRYIKKKNIFIHVVSFTNGLEISKSVGEKLVKYGLNELYCSIPAGTAETYSRVCPLTGEKGFLKIEENLKTLCKIKNKNRINKFIRKKIPEVTLAFVLHRLNYHEIIKMAEFAGKVGADKFRFQLIHLDQDNKHLKLQLEHLNFLRKNIEQIEQIAKKYSMVYHPSLRFQLSNINEEKGDWSEDVYVKKGCYIGWNFSIIKANYDLGLCCALKVVGNIKNDGFKKMWGSDKYLLHRVGAKFLRSNANMIFEKTIYHKEEGNNILLSEKCQRCDNHDLNNYMINLIEECGLTRYMGTFKE